MRILDPFTGTGTFMARLFDLGLIAEEDLDRKYREELFANDIVLLAYYVASVNIENAYQQASSSEDYLSFPGLCLTDTFAILTHIIQISSIIIPVKTKIFHDFHGFHTDGDYSEE